MKLIYLCLIGLIVPANLLAQTYDVDIQSAYFRSGVGSAYAEGLTYYMVPLTQLTPIEFSAVVKNTGSSTFTGVHLSTTIEKDAYQSVINSSSVSLAPNAQDSAIALPAYTPTEGVGMYTISWNFEGDFIDEVPGNDTMYSSFEVTNTTYARDNGIQQNTIGNIAGNGPNPVQIGNFMEIFGDGYINSVSIKISNHATNEGQFVFGSVYKYNTLTSDFELLGQTDDYLIQNSDLNNFVHLDLPNTPHLQAGDFIVVCAGNYGGTQAVRFGQAQLTTDYSVYGYGFSGTWMIFGSPRALMIRADIADYALVNQNVALCDGQSVNVGSSTYSTSGVYYDTLTTYLGADSVIVTNLEVTMPYNIIQNVTICDGEQLTVGSSVYSVAGSYDDLLLTVNAGCDSAVHTNLTIANPINLAITQTLTSLICQEAGATYQWLDCNNGNAPIPGATSQVFVLPSDGSYSVIVDNGGCVDTSSCVTVVNLGNADLLAPGNISIYPNPTNGKFTVQGVKSASKLEVTNLFGEIVLTTILSNQFDLDISDCASGVYFVRVYSDENYVVVKLIKQ